MRSVVVREACGTCGTLDGNCNTGDCREQTEHGLQGQSRQTEKHFRRARGSETESDGWAAEIRNLKWPAASVQ